MAEIGEPIRRRVVFPNELPAEPNPYKELPKREKPLPAEPVKTPEKVPAP